MSEHAPALNRSNAVVFAQSIRDHEAFVLRRRSGVRRGFRFWKLSGIKLSGRHLDEIDFAGADLSDTDFSGSRLDFASFNCATLWRSDFSLASMRRADLRGAKLMGARLDAADLDGADFRQATIAYTDRKGGWKVVGGTQSGERVSFVHCSLKGARLDNANLKDANFNGAILSGASFKGTTLGDATFDGAVLMGVDVQALRIDQKRLANSVLDPGPDLYERLPTLQAQLDNSEQWTMSGGRRGCLADFEGQDIRVLGGAMRQRKLTGIRLAGTTAIGLDLSYAELQGAKFDRADLRGADFSGADLRGASFKGANLAHACFRDADVSALALKTGELLTTDFSDAVTVGAKFLPFDATVGCDATWAVDDAAATGTR